MSRTAGRVEAADSEQPGWGMLEAFVLVQWLSSALLLIPGTQELRTPIRALPYVVSLAMVAVQVSRFGFPARLPRWSRLLSLALLLLAVELFHPLTNLSAGVAQVLLQVSIAAPVFWVASQMRGRAQLDRLIWLFFLAAAANSAVGVLQVYYPGTFMPPEFSTLALSLNPDAISSLTYIGAGGREIIRPPGFSDYPGGASVAGMMTGMLGIVLASQRGASMRRRFFCVALAMIGLATLYLTQVRSLAIMMVGSIAAMVLLLLRQRRVRESAAVLGLGSALIVLAFVWATAVGGESVSARFMELFDRGPIATYEQSRGGFVTHTVSELLLHHPLGAGLGRWGMMNVHFASPGDSEPIYVEIQMTGWLLDGGVLMWILYGAAIFFAMRFIYVVAARSQDAELAYAAAIAFCVCLIVVGQSMAGPPFNTVLGMQFWVLVSGVYGAVRQRADRRRRLVADLDLPVSAGARLALNGTGVVAGRTSRDFTR